MITKSSFLTNAQMSPALAKKLKLFRNPQNLNLSTSISLHQWPRQTPLCFFREEMCCLLRFLNQQLLHSSNWDRCFLPSDPAGPMFLAPDFHHHPLQHRPLSAFPIQQILSSWREPDRRRVFMLRFPSRSTQSVFVMLSKEIV